PGAELPADRRGGRGGAGTAGITGFEPSLAPTFLLDTPKRREIIPVRRGGPALPVQQDRGLGSSLGHPVPASSPRGDEPDAAGVGSARCAITGAPAGRVLRRPELPMAKVRRPAPDEDGPGDPLGKLLEDYRVSLAGVLIVSGVVAVIGLGVIAYAVTRQPL